MLEIGEYRLNQLRQAIVSALSEDEGLDTQSLAQRMMENGFETELRSLLNERVYTHAAFARTSAEPEDVYEGWQQALKTYNK